MCIHSQLERLKTEGEVDIFKYLKTARTRRMGLLSDLVRIISPSLCYHCCHSSQDHYVLCHEVMIEFIDSFDLYANFKSF